MSYELDADEVRQVVSWHTLSDGSRRAHYRWASKTGHNLANILIVPGLGEHGGRYAEAADFFARHSFDVTAIDLIGHGLSPGKRGCIRTYEGLLNEIEEALKVFSVRDPQLPSILWGHSLGGNLVLNYLLRKSDLPNYAIATGPMLRAARPPSELFLWFAQKLAVWLPNYRLKAPVRPADCTRDPRQRELMSNDRLFHRLLSLRLGAALIASGLWALDHAGQLHTPLILLHGQHDKITSATASQEFSLRSGRNCDLRILPEQLHDVHRDIGSDLVLQAMSDWICLKMKATGQVSSKR